MNILKSKISKIFLGVFILTGLNSCENDGYADYTVETTPSVAMNGEWFIDISDDSGLLVAHSNTVTYDTNEGNNTMYINDNKEGWWLFGKVNVNNENLTFSVVDEENGNDPGSTFTILEGKVLQNAAHTKSGNVTDSIYFKATFSYQPNRVLTFSGHRRTGFLEDEY